MKNMFFYLTFLIMASVSFGLNATDIATSEKPANMQMMGPKTTMVEKPVVLAHPTIGMQNGVLHHYIARKYYTPLPVKDSSVDIILQWYLTSRKDSTQFSNTSPVIVNNTGDSVKDYGKYECSGMNARFGKTEGKQPDRNISKVVKTKVDRSIKTKAIDIDTFENAVKLMLNIKQSLTMVENDNVVSTDAEDSSAFENNEADGFMTLVTQEENDFDSVVPTENPNHRVKPHIAKLMIEKTASHLSVTTDDGTVLNNIRYAIYDIYRGLRIEGGEGTLVDGKVDISRLKTGGMYLVTFDGALEPVKFRK